ncbi:MAG: protein kinase [Polyangiales bacterium]
MSLLVPEGSPSEPPKTAGRYRIEREIASGGMGAVFVAFDCALGRNVALKRLLGNQETDRRTRMFEREFHTLSALKHPRIIEVFDYGIDEQGPYYTMELLDGSDLRELAPLPYKTACRYLRDVASSLALLHARNLLHRDLSPRNVRVTSDGRAKLIDFGTLCGFGKVSTIVGTAPFVAPEALERQALDQRADLFGLGALGYFLLTRRHAFDARTFAELPDAWLRQPEPPSARAPKDGEPIPLLLDELVLALLSRNPLARPASAAEVISRLSAIAGLEPDKEPLSALSYLQGGKRVGRRRERARLRRRLKATLAGSGSSVTIEAQAGMGVASILGELATEAHVSGAVAVVIDAGSRRGGYAVAEDIVRALMIAAPDKTRDAMRGLEGSLERFIAAAETPLESRVNVPGQLGAPDRSGMDPREARLRTQAALLELVDRLAKQVPLVLAVHRLHQADDASAAFLAALGRDGEQRRLLLVLAYDPDEEAVGPAALHSLRESTERLHLRGLRQSEVRAWVKANFGEIDNSERLAEWLHETAGGNPKACHDLAQHLIEQGVIRFGEGVWTLPAELALAELPSSLDQALGARIARLHDRARRLLAAVAVHRGPLPLERCLAFASAEGIDEPLRTLAELEHQGLLALDEDRARLDHPSLRAAVVKRLGRDELRRLHATLGQLLWSQGADGDLDRMLDAGWHLLHGGDERRGADILAEVGLARSYDAANMPAAIPALRAALEAFRAQGRSQHEIAKLIGPLALAGYYSDRAVVDTYAEDALQVMGEVLGIARAARLRRWLGPQLGLMVGMSSGIIGFVRREGLRKGLRSFQDMVPLFVTTAGTAASIGIVTLDGPRARRYIEHIAPLTVLGPDSGPGLAYRFMTAAALATEDRMAQALAGLRPVLARLEDPRPIAKLPELPRLMMYGGALYTAGAIETFREDPAALALADKLEGLGLKLFEMFAHQIRCNYHGVRGELAAAEQHRKRAELLGVQAGSGWQVELWAASGALLCSRLAQDLVGVRGAMARLEQLSCEVPSLKRHAKMAVMAYHGLRGEWESLIRHGDELQQGARPRAFVGWSSSMAGQVRARTALGQAEAARSLGQQALAQLDADDRQMTAIVTNLITEVALAEAACSDFGAAAARVDGYLAELGGRGGPITVGALHEARAEIAKQAGDMLAARQHLLQVEAAFAPTRNPALVARVEQLRRSIEQDSTERGSSHATTDFGVVREVELQQLIAACQGPERFERVLELLLQHTRGRQGWLYSYDGHGLTIVAPSTPGELPKTALDDLRAEIASYSKEEGVTEDLSEIGTGTALSQLSEVTGRSAPGYRTFLLCTERGGTPVVVAAAVIAQGDRPLRAPLQTFLSALGHGLSSASGVLVS